MDFLHDRIDWQERPCEETAFTLYYDYELPIVLLRGDRPIAAHWDRHTYTPAEIEYEFERDPNLNIGLMLGPRSGLMEVVTVHGDGMQSESDYDELVGDLLLLTPTFTSRTGHHRLFKWDERLAALSEHGLNFKSVSLRTPKWGACSILPPSITHGLKREWRLHPDDCHGQFEELPHFAVDTLLMSYKDHSPAGRMSAMSH